MNIEVLEKFLLDTAAQARKDAQSGAAPDVDSILSSEPLLKEINEGAVKDTISALRQIAATKDGARKIVSILSLAVKYGATML